MTDTVGKYEDLRAGADSLPVVTGSAWTVGDAVSRAQLLADAALDRPATEACRALLAALDPTLAARVAAGDVLVAGHAFGVGVTQPAVPAAMKALGLQAVLARSFADAFEPTALDVGLAPLVVEETGAIQRGDRLRVDVEAHVVANLSSGDRYVIRNIDDAALARLRAAARGGA